MKLMLRRTPRSHRNLLAHRKGASKPHQHLHHGLHMNWNIPGWEKGYRSSISKTKSLAFTSLSRLNVIFLFLLKSIQHMYYTYRFRFLLPTYFLKKGKGLLSTKDKRQVAYYSFALYYLPKRSPVCCGSLQLVYVKYIVTSNSHCFHLDNTQRLRDDAL